ncbi:hypothetical protein PHET_08374 [Paragonimus heterotremus]|uniref:Uncharacterized protein n=1 Tax=Paragonimus heterotremus TaxID=100268 RepID=A0A8J4TDG5_9TREM|nr:hypothetical protein PHET_08374 [Paragonimus heterotremus]
MSSNLDTKEKKVVKSKPVSAVVNGSVAVPGSYVDEYAVRLPVCTSTDIKNGSGVSAVSGIVPHLDLALNSGHSSKESSSGFMLISVGHLSKVRRDKCRTKSASSLDSKTNARSYGVIDHNSVESSSREGSSPSYSQSPVGDDFYGSGHIEAEEFEEDTEDYVTNEDDGTVTHNATVKLLAKRYPRDASRMGSCVQCAPISANSEASCWIFAAHG